MRVILYRIELADYPAFEHATTTMTGVQRVMRKRRGFMVDCADDISDVLLGNLDAMVQQFAVAVIEGDGPGMARRVVQPGDDRTGNVTIA